MSRKLSSVWITGVPEDRKEEYVKTILNSTIVLERMSKIIDAFIEQVELEELNEDHFNNPEWAVRQAFIMGQKKSLRKFKTVISGALNE